METTNNTKNKTFKQRLKGLLDKEKEVKFNIDDVFNFGKKALASIVVLFIIIKFIQALWGMI